MGEINFRATPRLRDEGAAIRRARRAVHTCNLRPALKKNLIGMESPLELREKNNKEEFSSGDVKGGHRFLPEGPCKYLTSIWEHDACRMSNTHTKKQTVLCLQPLMCFRDGAH